MKVQRCQVHVARDVLAKVPRKLKKAIADETRFILYAPTEKEESPEVLPPVQSQSRRRKSPQQPSSLRTPLRLTSLQFTDEEGICLRTTNVIERVNKEFKRRTTSMEILPGKRSCNTLTADFGLP